MKNFGCVFKNFINLKQHHYRKHLFEQGEERAIVNLVLQFRMGLVGNSLHVCLFYSSY